MKRRQFCNGFVTMVSLQWLHCTGFVTMALLSWQQFVAVVFDFPVCLCLYTKYKATIFLDDGLYQKISAHPQGLLRQLKCSVCRTNFFKMTSMQYYLTTIYFLIPKPATRTRDIHRVNSNRREHSTHLQVFNVFA